MPVYLFAVSQVQQVHWGRAVLVFIILHLLVYPSSNGYNSYMDRDETPIGGLQKPMQPTRQLFYTTLVMDALAILLSFYVSVFFAAGVLLYILASRAYSYRGIRLKRLPVMGFLTVFIFQGALIFFITYHAVHLGRVISVPLLPCLISSVLIGALYPLTQVYQHEEDKRDGVTTISYLLGKRGTFIFCMVLFLSATALMYFFLAQQNRLNQFSLFLLMLLPAVSYFLYWMQKVWKRESAADFKHSFMMYVLATICSTLFFLTLIIQKCF
ncbi:MAG: UbiA prenyltransferase family protein [Flavisolibacter sp.]|nr:UbiA prenyltransferase family protein [Flavisolibacter sp.]